MARSYHIDFAAFVADVDRKWIDNLLSHFDVPGVESARQGVARRLSIDAIRMIALVRALSRDGGLPVDRALGCAISLLESPANRTPIGPWLELMLDRPTFQREVD